MGQINTNNYPTVDSLADTDLLIVENAAHGTGTTTPKQLRENAIGTAPLQTTEQTVTGAINELKSAIDSGAGVACYDVDDITDGYLGEFDGSSKIMLLHMTTSGEADADNGYTMMLEYTRPVARYLYGQLVDTNGFPYMKGMYADTTVECLITTNGTGTELDPRQVLVLGVLGGYVTTGWDHMNALGDRATAEGAETNASGNQSHAGGYQTTASGNQSVAMGYNTTASNDNSVAMGNGTTASGGNAVASGYNTVASGPVSTAMGTNTQATQQAQVAAGKYNRVNNDALVMVGNGTGASARSNALEVLLNGDVVAGNDIIDGQGNTLSVLAEALTKTASGNPIVITDCAGGKARSLKTTIEPIQEGEGDPSPTNIRPISGRTEVRVDTENEDGTESAYAVIQLGQTVYGAEVDFDTGVVTVTHVIKAMDADDMSYGYSSGTQRINTTSLQSVIKAVANTDVANIICSCFVKDSANGTSIHNIDGSIAVDSTGVIYIYSSLYTDASTFKTAMSGQTICYKLATPTTLQLTPAQLELLKGFNRVSIEAGEIELGYIAKLT